MNFGFFIFVLFSIFNETKRISFRILKLIAFLISFYDK